MQLDQKDAPHCTLRSQGDPCSCGARIALQSLQEKQAFRLWRRQVLGLTLPWACPGRAAGAPAPGPMHAQLPVLWGPLGGQGISLRLQRSPVASESWPLFLCKYLLFLQTNGGFSIHTKGRARTVPPESELRAAVDLGWGWGGIRGWGWNLLP